MGDASSVRFLVAEEASFGVNPAAGAKTMRITSVSPRLRANNIQSAEIDPTRQPAGSVRTSKAAELSMGYELSLVAPAASPGNGYDGLIEGACMSDWSAVLAGTGEDIDIVNVVGATFDLDDMHVSADAFTGVVVGQILKVGGFAVNGTIYARVTAAAAGLVSCTGVRSTGAAVTAEAGNLNCTIAGSHIRIGSTKKSYTGEVQYTDLTVPEYSLLTGLRVGTWEQRFSPEGIVGGTFNFTGKLQDTTTASAIGAADAKWATPRINTTDQHFKNKMEGSFGAVATGMRIAEINFRLDNRLRTDLELGEPGPLDIGISTPVLEGTLVVYMQNADLLRKFEDDTLSKLSWMLDDGTRQQIYSFNSIRYRDAEAPAQGNDSTVRVSIPFSAEADANGVAFQIDRF